jgi:DNA-binding NtrC family response regulator
MLKLQGSFAATEEALADGGATTDKARILVVDDDPIVADSLVEFLRAEGHEVASCAGGAEALDALAQAENPPASATRKPRPYNLVLSDVAMPTMSGLDLLRTLGERFPYIVAIMLTGYGTIESAVEAIRAGASDYLSKPVVDSELRLAIGRALRQQALLAENRLLRERLDQRFGMGSIVGGDYRMQKAYELIEAVAPSKATVLMTGESGTGKSLVARAVHENSPRRGKPFVEIHCGSIPETLLESELFGHVKGAFTGAHADKEGKFLAADGGTIFIDEINSATPAMQLKLLRVLQERRFEPVGSTQTTEVDVRVILASNQSLEQMVSEGKFRQDLYYRINVVKIELPALRERAADVPVLAKHFLRELSVEHGKAVTAIAPDTMEALKRYAFPGNVRELRNVIERAVVLTRTPTITTADLPAHVSYDGTGPAPESLSLLGTLARGLAEDEHAPWTPMPLERALEEPEKRILLRALKANNWNRQATADQLEINRTTLYKKIKAYGLDRVAG